MNLARAHGYKTFKGAKKKLIDVLVPSSGELDTVHIPWVIAVNNEGRYVPCVVGSKYTAAIHSGLTVLGG